MADAMIQQQKPRPVFTIRLQAKPGVDEPIKALRLALKVLLRRFGLRAISVSEEK
jgi:hypothetical protein